MASQREDAPSSSYNSALQRFLALLRTGDLSDVTFVVGGGDSHKEFRVHRNILSTASDVFRTMFCGSLPEGETPIEVPDLHPDGFDAMLKYVYGDIVEFSSVDNAVRTLAVATKYLMDDLKQICCDSLVFEVTPDVACCMYEAACLYDAVDLKRSAFTYFIFNTETVINHDSFLSAHQSTVQTILLQDTLSVPSERQLFDAVLRWGKANAIKERDPDGDKTAGDIRAVVDPLLPYIRFLKMSSIKFCEGPAQSGVLTDEEILSLMMNINCPGSRSLPPWVSQKSSRKSAMETSVYPMCRLQNHDEESSQSLIQGDITVVGTHVFWGVELILKKCNTNWTRRRTAVVRQEFLNQDSVTVNVTFFMEVLNYRKSENGSYIIQRNGECRVILKKPLVIYDGETCKINIRFKEDVTVLRCKGPEVVRDTPNVLFRTDCPYIHAVVHGMLECGVV